MAVDGQISTPTGGTITMMGPNVRIGPVASLQAPGGRVQVLAADSSPVTGSVNTGFTLPASATVRARVVQPDGFQHRSARHLRQRHDGVGLLHRLVHHPRVGGPAQQWGAEHEQERGQRDGANGQPRPFPPPAGRAT